MKVDVLAHIRDAKTLYELTTLEIYLLNLIVRESTILPMLPCKQAARMLRGLAHVIENHVIENLPEREGEK